MLLRRNLMFIFTIIIFSTLCIQAQEGRRSRYRYNHPPSIESIDTVPVAVVYESGNVRENKALKVSTNVATTPKENLISSNDDKISTQGSTQEVTSDNSTQIQNVKKIEEQVEKKFVRSKHLGTKNTRANLEIPVTVIYETEPDVFPANKEINQSSSTPITNRKLIRRRLPKPKVDENVQVKVVNDEKNNSIEKKDSTVTLISPPTTDSSLTVSIKNETQENTEKPRKRGRTRHPVVPIVTEKNFVFAHSGNFHYSFEGGDGTKVFEEGALKSIENDAGEAVYGGFSYKDREGNDYSLSYTADENGYRPIGAHLPTPPPIPPAIARALAYLATKSTPQTTTESIKSLD